MWDLIVSVHDHCLSFYFTCFKTCNAVTSGIRFCGKTPAIFDFHLYRIFSETTRGNFVETLHINSFQCIDVSARKWFRFVKNKVVNCSLLNTVTISLSHLLRDHWSDFLNLSKMFSLLSSCVCLKKVPVRTPPPQHIAKKNVSVECQFLKKLWLRSR